jgi:hypothetical protein
MLAKSTVARRHATVVRVDVIVVLHRSVQSPVPERLFGSLAANLESQA